MKRFLVLLFLLSSFGCEYNGHEGWKVGHWKQKPNVQPLPGADRWESYDSYDEWKKQK